MFLKYNPGEENINIYTLYMCVHIYTHTYMYFVSEVALLWFGAGRQQSSQNINAGNIVMNDGSKDRICH